MHVSDFHYFEFYFVWGGYRQRGRGSRGRGGYHERISRSPPRTISKVPFPSNQDNAVPDSWSTSRFDADDYGGSIPAKNRDASPEKRNHFPRYVQKKFTDSPQKQPSRPSPPRKKKKLLTSPEESQIKKENTSPRKQKYPELKRYSPRKNRQIPCDAFQPWNEKLFSVRSKRIEAKV